METIEAMFRHWDIKLIVIAMLGAASYGLVFLLQNFSLNNVPDENVVYIDSSVGGVEADDEIDGGGEATALQDASVADVESATE